MAIAAALFAASCGGSSSSSGSSASSESIRGQTITVLVPYAMPPEAARPVHRRRPASRSTTCVTGWDATHNKLFVANTANTYIADVAEFDWSFTGQFAGARWVEPLDNVLSAKTLADLKNTDAAFMSGGKTYAACYSNDFRDLDVQQEDVRQGGHHHVPGHASTSWRPTSRS